MWLVATLFDSRGLKYKRNRIPKTWIPASPLLPWIIYLTSVSFNFLTWKLAYK